MLIEIVQPAKHTGFLLSALRKLKKTYNDMSIFIKHSVVTIFIVLTPLIIISTFTYLNSEKAILKETELSYQQFIVKLGNEVNIRLRKVEEISIKILSDPQVQDFLSNSENYKDYSKSMALQSELAINYHDNAFMDIVSIVIENGQTFSSRLYQKDNIEWEELVEFTEGLNFSESGIVMVKQDNGAYILYHIRRIYSMDNFKFRGFILIRIRPDALMKPIDSLIGDIPVQLLLEDKANVFYNKIFNTKEDTIMSEKKLYSSINLINESSADGIEKRISGKKFFITQFIVQPYQWKMIAIISFDRVAVRIKELREFIFILGFPCAFFACLLSMWLTLDIVKPIRAIISLMSEVEQKNFDIQMNIERNDEVGKLARSFINMVDHIKMLLRKLVNEERQKHKAEIFALQTQISPHFLYNTINSIKCLSAIKGQKDIEDMCSSLIGLLKVSFRDGTSSISIKDELSFIRQYVNLMQYRYGEDTFCVRIKNDPAVLNCMMPRLLLQPLVENAINHGIDISKTGGEITLTIVDCADSIYFEVMDNGAGISEELMRKILDGDSGENLSGLRNTCKRIKLYFGEQHGLKINSIAGKGTRIYFSIPRYYPNKEGEPVD